MTTEFQKDRAAEIAAIYREANTLIFHAWLETHPQIDGREPVDCLANLGLFAAYMDFDSRELTFEDFAFAHGNLASSLATVKVLSEEEIVKAVNAHRKKLSLTELQELARQERPLPTRGTLPESWYGVSIATASELKNLARTNLASFRALVARFGSEEVNARLGITPTAPVGRSISLKF
jgi:hypothetical protein